MQGIKREFTGRLAPLSRRLKQQFIMLPLLFLTSFSFSGLVQAIVIRHDKSDARYVVDEKHYPQLFYLQLRNEHKVCLATMISARWAITAGHCVEDTPLLTTLNGNESWSVVVNGQPNDVVRLELHPEYLNSTALEGVDLALIQLSDAVTGIAPVTLQRQDDELSRTATLLGWGATGDGTSGWLDNDGRFRRAYNKVSATSRWIHFSFSDPRDITSESLSLEGIPGLGDSGGPALLETTKGLVLIGVAVGELNRTEESVSRGFYGAEEIYERIYLHLDWIDTITASGEL